MFNIDPEIWWNLLVFDDENVNALLVSLENAVELTEDAIEKAEGK